MKCLLCNSKLKKNNKTNYCSKCRLKFFPLRIDEDNIKCEFCGGVAKYILQSQKYCCCKKANSCPTKRLENKNRQKNLKHVFDKFDNPEKLLCQYGCNKVGKFISSNKKICCSDSTNKCLAKRKRNSITALIYTKDPEWRKALSERGKGKIVSEETRQKQSISRKNSPKVKDIMNSEENRNKKRINQTKLMSEKYGYLEKGKYTSYDTYAKHLSFIEKVRRDPIEPRILQVKCIYCGKWFRPTTITVCNRNACINNDPNISTSQNNFYCSNECKSLCPVFKKIKYPEGFKKEGRIIEVSPEIRKMVLERDNWECQKCGSDKFLECHHIDPVSTNPLFANDIDSCITFCKKCHKFVHTEIEGCGYNDLKKKNICK